MGRKTQQRGSFDFSLRKEVQSERQRQRVCEVAPKEVDMPVAAFTSDLVDEIPALFDRHVADDKVGALLSPAAA